MCSRALVTTLSDPFLIRYANSSSAWKGFKKCVTTAHSNICVNDRDRDTCCTIQHI